MSTTKKSAITILSILFNTMVQFAHADAVDPNLLRKNREGEDRPSWWYDLWYENGITVLASLKHKIPENPDMGAGQIFSRSRKFRLSGYFFVAMYMCKNILTP
jgi:hypothetical protein